MISIIHDIEFREQLALQLAAVMEDVVWTERSCSSPPPSARGPERRSSP
jgi:hypothetical protein